jgi:hypothetical protein
LAHDTIKITTHLKKRAEHRFDLKLNRQARTELSLLAWDKKKSKILERQGKFRSVRLIPLFLSRAVRELNEDIKFGDTIIAVCDSNVRKVITVLPEYRAGYTLYKSSYNIDNAKW